MMTIRPLIRLAAVAPLAVAVLFAVGCKSAPGLNKQFGHFYEWVEAPLDRALPAARAGARDANARVIEERTSGNKVTLIARNPDNARVEISLTQAGANRTRIGVKVTPGEPEGYSRIVLNSIKERLKEPRPTPEDADRGAEGDAGGDENKTGDGAENADEGSESADGE
jgi:hypothetical protein